MTSATILWHIAFTESERRARAVPAAIAARQITQERADDDARLWAELLRHFGGELPALPDFWPRAVDATCRAAHTALKAHIADPDDRQKGARYTCLTTLARSVSITATVRGIETAAQTYARATDFRALTPQPEREAA